MRTGILIALLLLPFCVQAKWIAPGTSMFNGRDIRTDSTGNYSFIVSGHFYGDGTNQSGFPANTLLAKLDDINQSGACMMICLGDLFKDPANDLPNYQSSLF